MRFLFALCVTCGTRMSGMGVVCESCDQLQPRIEVRKGGGNTSAEEGPTGAPPDERAP